jgi:hypothetical protein
MTIFDIRLPTSFIFRSVRIPGIRFVMIYSSAGYINITAIKRR